MKKSSKNKINILRDNFIQHAEQITVDLSKCEIETDNNFTVVNKNNTSGITLLDYMGGYSNKGANEESPKSVIIYKYEHNGEIETFRSHVVYMGKRDLQYKLSSKRQTSVYVNTEDRNVYFFDLNFLFE